MKTEKLENPLASVIVLYNTDLANSLTFKALEKSLIHAKSNILLIVYDNSPLAQVVSDSIHENFPGQIVYIHDKSNPGVSKAYNVAAKIASKNLCKWILLFDQDTDFREDALSYYFEAISTTSEQIIAPVLKDISGKYTFSPCLYLFKRGFWLKNITYGVTKFKNINFLNSGMCINLNLFNSVGGFNEGIKLYFSDFEFFERIYKIKSSYLQLNYFLIHSMESNNMESAEIAAKRFRIYMKSVFEVSKFSNLYSKLLYIVWALLRACKMAFKFNSLIFFKLFFNYNK